MLRAYQIGLIFFNLLFYKQKINETKIAFLS